MGGWGQSQNKDHPSPAKGRVGVELGNIVDHKLFLFVGN